MKSYLVFDVESMGLHGVGFAVGAVVVDEDGTERASFVASCPTASLPIREPDVAWMREHCFPVQTEPAFDSPREVRDAFWWFLRVHPDASLWTDCGWPVEARFLAACIDDDPRRWWEGPYPLHEIATLRLAAGFDPLATNSRRSDEMPVHNPLADARQSARLMLEAMRAVKPTPEPAK